MGRVMATILCLLSLNSLQTVASGTNNRTFCSSVKNLNFGPASSGRCLSYSNVRIHLGPASLGWYRCLSYSSAPVGIHPDKISIQEKDSFGCREDMAAGREAWPQEAE